MVRRLARLRVPLGFACAAVALVFARPTWMSWSAGLPIAVLGEALRCWAAGHIEKGREITRSGPYRFVRHPLYLGSSVVALGFIVAANSLIVAVVGVLYVGVTLVAAIRLEEAVLDEKFQGAYTAYREGRGDAALRAFSWARLTANREYHAILGLAVVFAFLAYRALRP
jgi:protein-S-isoprenylcysteine O-methyltransferase Ste14